MGGCANTYCVADLREVEVAKTVREAPGEEATETAGSSEGWARLGRVAAGLGRTLPIARRPKRRRLSRSSVANPGAVSTHLR